MHDENYGHGTLAGVNKLLFTLFLLPALKLDSTMKMNVYVNVEYRTIIWSTYM